MNKVILKGRLGKDAELKNTPSGAGVINVSLATDESYVKDGQKVDKTEWHNLVIWRKDKIAPYLTKGKEILVEGKIETRSWDDKEGNKRYTTEINVFNVEFCGSAKSDEASKPAAAPSSEAQAYDTADDVPF